MSDGGDGVALRNREPARKKTYSEVSASDVPSDIVWDVPRRNQGQIVEVAYSRGIPAHRRVNHAADHGDPWKRVTDGSDRSVRYFRREV